MKRSRTKFASFTIRARKSAKRTEIPTTFAPAAHNHVIADVTGLQGALDGKAADGANTDITSLLQSTTFLVFLWVELLTFPAALSGAQTTPNEQ